MKINKMITVDHELIPKMKDINVSEFCNQKLHELLDKKDLMDMSLEELHKLKAEELAEAARQEALEKYNAEHN